jgi:arrestin-related trafficking adapter 3/6
MQSIVIRLLLTAPCAMTVQSRSLHDRRRSRIYYSARDLREDKNAPATLPIPPFCARRHRPQLIQITRLPANFESPLPQAAANNRESLQIPLNTGKLASREQAKRFFGLVLSPFSSSTATSPAGNINRSGTPGSSARSAIPSPLSPRHATPVTSPIASPSLEDTMAAAQVARLQDVPGTRSSLSLASTGTGRSNTPTATSRSANAMQLDLGDKPVASAAGVSCSIVLAEPYVYLNGFDLAAHTPSSQNSTSMIRGKLVLNVTKSAKIKAVTLSFCGKARTEWPEGI